MVDMNVSETDCIERLLIEKIFVDIYSGTGIKEDVDITIVAHGEVERRRFVSVIDVHALILEPIR